MDDDDGTGSTSSGYWKQNLLVLQERAPPPKAVIKEPPVKDRPIQYANEPAFHGLITREEVGSVNLWNTYLQADVLLRHTGNGAYLIRESTRGQDAFTLCMLSEGKILNYKLYYDGTHYVGEKRFETIESLVADGLISMYIDIHAAEYIRRMADDAIYEHSPYMLYTRDTDSICKKTQQARAHNFSPFTFKMPHYCDYCRNFMWGLVQQGVRCDDCGFAAHKKCSERTQQDCRPEAKYVKRMFAVDLMTLCIAHQVEIPPVVDKCISEVEFRGLNVEGIYRVSGSHDHIEKLRRQFDSQHGVDLTQVEDIHTVCGLLKLYLRLLPQQLVPFTVYKPLMSAFVNSRSSQERLRTCRKALEELTEANAKTLHTILSHLRKVTEFCAVNKMTIENVATIFSPTLFCTGITPSLPQQQHTLLYFMITNPKVVPYV